MMRSETFAKSENAFTAMDRMYRLQRYFYDFTRKYYLLGRDRLLEKMSVASGDKVLEIGCGTGRNIIVLGRKHPDADFFGLDASSAMLITGQAKIDAARLKNLKLKTALADDFAFDATFGLDGPFDTIFFSYSISMIPTWRESIDNALRNLKQGGQLYVVDFYDQRNLPGWFKILLQSWLRKFHVQFWYDLLPYLRSMEASGSGIFELTSLYRRYSFIAAFKKN